MKEFVMKTSNYKSHIWYAATSEEEKVLVDKLIAAQTEQGDMTELIVRQKSTSYEYTDQPYRGKLFASEPIIVGSDKNCVFNPNTQILIPIEKSVGLFCSNYALCHIYANKNFYE